MIRTPLAIVQPTPITTFAWISTSSATFAVPSITAVAWTNGLISRSGKNNRIARVYGKYESFARNTAMSLRPISMPSLRKIADAFVFFTCGRYLGLARNVMSPSPAMSSPAVERISSPGSPCSMVEPVFSANSSSFIRIPLIQPPLVCHTIFANKLAHAKPHSVCNIFSRLVFIGAVPQYEPHHA